MISADTMIRIASRLESVSNDACLGHNDVRMTPQATDALAKCIRDYVREPERPTCRLDLTDVETYGNLKVRIYECSECGRTCEEIYGKYERCPHCGAEVLDEDSAN